MVALTASSFVSRASELRRHVAAQDYDVLLGMMPHWNLLVLLATLGRSGSAPAVLISGRTVESPVRRAYGWSFRAQLALCHLLYRRADGYIAISHPVAAEAIGTYGLDAAKVWVVPNPATAKAPGSKPRPARRTPSRTAGHRHVDGAGSADLEQAARGGGRDRGRPALPLRHRSQRGVLRRGTPRGPRPGGGRPPRRSR